MNQAGLARLLGAALRAFAACLGSWRWGNGRAQGWPPVSRQRLCQHAVQ